MIKTLRKLMTAFVACVSLMLCSCDTNSSNYIVKITSGNSITLQVGGESVELQTEVSSKQSGTFDPTLIWTSADTNIVEVDNSGHIVGRSEGQTYVTATLKIDPKAKATCSVIVEPNDNHFVVDPAKIQLNIASDTLKTTKLQVYKDGVAYSNVSWSSRDKSVATVSSAGKVTAKGEGKAFIEAKDKNGNGSATCVVTVIDSSGKVTGLEVTPKTLSLDAYTDKTATLTANVIGQNSYSKEVNWTSDDPNVAVVNTVGLVTAIGEGTCEIKATSIADTSIYDTCVVTVTDSAPIEVTLNKTSIDIAAGKTKQLSATVLHSSNQNVTWSGNANGISVDQSGLVTASGSASAGATATIKATSIADPTKSASCVVTVVSKPTYDYDYTLMFYMCASTLEYDDSADDPWSYFGGHGEQDAEVGLFSADIIEMLSVKDIPDTMNIIIETGGTEEWFFPSNAIENSTAISSSKLQRWEVSSSSSYNAKDPYSGEYVTCYNKLKLVETLSTNHMADQSSFQSFLEWGLRDYGADQMGVVISGHGGGVDGCAYDDNYSQNSLQAREVGAAAKTALSKYDRDKFTWIGYDCCLMGVADVASINSDYFEYMVASQESENGTGWNHDVYLKRMVSNVNIEPTELLPVISESFVSENCTSTYCNSRQGYCQQTLSVLDLSKMDEFVSSFNAFVNSFGYDESTFATYKSVFKNTHEFGESIYGLVDAKHFLNLCYKQKADSKINAVLTAIDNMVIANNYCSRYAYKSNPCGLSLFLAYSTDMEYGIQVGKANYTSQDTKLTSWQSMNSSYGEFYSGY